MRLECVVFRVMRFWATGGLEGVCEVAIGAGMLVVDECGSEHAVVGVAEIRPRGSLCEKTLIGLGAGLIAARHWRRSECAVNCVTGFRTMGSSYAECEIGACGSVASDL